MGIAKKQSRAGRLLSRRFFWRCDPSGTLVAPAASLLRPFSRTGVHLKHAAAHSRQSERADIARDPSSRVPKKIDIAAL